MIRVPGDKSISHRALLLSALSFAPSRLEGLLPGEDCASTAAILRALGCPVPELPRDGGPIRVHGVGLRGLKAPGETLDCGNSGTTARLLLGLLSGLGVQAVLTGDASLRRRPMRRVTDPLGEAGARFREEGEPGCLPVRVAGGELTAVRHTSRVASAQVKSALLLAGVGAGVEVDVTEPAASRDHSERMLRRMGVQVQQVGSPPHRVVLPVAPTRLDPLDLLVPGDISSAAFLLVLGALGRGTLELANVGLNPTRTGALHVLRRMGARITVESAREMDDPGGEPAGDLVVQGGTLHATRIQGDEIPSLIDEIPILGVAAARAEGTTEIRDAAELRVKETDRIRALAVNLRAVGVEVEEHPDGLTIQGGDHPLQGRVRAFGDHRIAMAFGVLGALPGNRIEVDDPGVVDVSYPGFWEQLRALTHQRRAAAAAPAGESAAVPGSAPVAGSAAAAGFAPTPGSAPVVTLDGPAGSGKSSTAKAVARELGFRHLDSGALYRAATLVLLDSDLPPEAWEARGAEAVAERGLALQAVDDGFQVTLGGEPVAPEALRSPRVTERVSAVSAMAPIRDLILEPLRAAGLRGGIVADGRDMGTVVFPQAEVKVYLTASISERARRRILQDGGELSATRIEEEARRLADRDAQDRNREVAPLRRPAEALDVDTTGLDFPGQVALVVARVREVWGNGNGAGL